eukprot:scaffold12150_cov98-Isochrysis_galbana.AAC.2
MASWRQGASEARPLPPAAPTPTVALRLRFAFPILSTMHRVSTHRFSPVSISAPRVDPLIQSDLFQLCGSVDPAKVHSVSKSVTARGYFSSTCRATST